jgi:hypothetical protein
MSPWHSVFLVVGTVLASVLAMVVLVIAAHAMETYSEWRAQRRRAREFVRAYKATWWRDG